VVSSEECRLELSVIDSSISRIVVSSDEELNLLHGWVDSNGVKSRLELIGGNLSVSIGIENTKRIRDVEVTLHGELDLGTLKLLLKVAKVLQGVYKLIFIINSEGWLSGW